MTLSAAGCCGILLPMRFTATVCPRRREQEQFRQRDSDRDRGTSGFTNRILKAYASRADVLKFADVPQSTLFVDGTSVNVCQNSEDGLGNGGGAGRDCPGPGTDQPIDTLYLVRFCSSKSCVPILVLVASYRTMSRSRAGTVP